jgi:hypothetical protein
MATRAIVRDRSVSRNTPADECLGGVARAQQRGQALTSRNSAVRRV